MEQRIFKGSTVVKARDLWEVQFIYFLFLDFDMQSIEILLKYNRHCIDMISDSHISISQHSTTSSIQGQLSAEIESHAYKMYILTPQYESMVKVKIGFHREAKL
ncbi:hypothetical protein NE237_001679 [Protea cynaroides]|uniref:Uncharacterized protein n=1 Tax=Protea cynaroides TaxID=273540 RepID=A0A9Q0QYB3_9MAGN|nr:hypothetical protein NE237_001679 [Protea cynaroides]